MSDLMYDQCSLFGKPYKYGDWKSYSAHDEHNIRGFFGEFRWLSNFHECKVPYEGLIYPSSEGAYQAAKCISELREPFTKMTAYNSKNAWKMVPEEGLLPDWETRKFYVMSEVVFDKFLHNQELRDKLYHTGNKYLEELNHWGDDCWGVKVQNNQGSNHLGRTLMATRAYFQHMESSTRI